jgi:hypothetical protein
MEERASTMKNKTNPAAAGPEEMRMPKFRNADNHDLWPWEKLPIGDVPEVNGYWADEIHDFVPTSGELLVLRNTGPPLL